jgi:hypothetical protein
MLDQKSFNQFLHNNSLKNSQTSDKLFFNQNLSNIQTQTNLNPSTKQLSSSILDYKLQAKSIRTLLLTNYKDLTSSFNNNSDKRFFLNPLFKLFNKHFFKLQSLNTNFINNILTFENTQTLNLTSNKFLNNSQVKKTFTLSSQNQNIALPDQNLRQYKNIPLNKTNFNLTGKTNFTPNSKLAQTETLYYNLKARGLNSNLFYKLSSNQLNISNPYSPIFTSTNLFHKPLNYDTSTKVQEVLKNNLMTNTFITHFYNVRKAINISLLKGKRDNAPDFLNRSY